MKFSSCYSFILTLFILSSVNNYNNNNDVTVIDTLIEAIVTYSIFSGSSLSTSFFVRLNINGFVF